MVLFRFDNVIFNDRIRLHADRLRATDEMQDEEKFSWEKQTQVMTKLRTLMNSEDFFSPRQTQEESFSNLFQ